jgi:hypothetical protein
MKKILTAIILAATITTGFAQWQPNQNGGPQQYPQQGNQQQYPRQNGNYSQYSSLIVSSVSQRQFLVYVDNYQYQANGNNGNNNTVNVDQLQAGNHNVVIYENRRNFWGKTVQSEVYNAALYLKPGFETSIFINALGQANVSERQVYNNNGGYDQGGYSNNGNGNGYGYGRKKHHKNKHKKNKCDDDDRRDYSRNDNRRDHDDRDDD